MENTIRILLIDEQKLFLAALRMLLDDQPGLSVVGVACDQAEAYQLVVESQPDIIVSDFLSSENDFIPQLLSVCKFARIIILTNSSDHRTQQQALKLGVMGIVHKTKAPDILISAIKKVHQGEAWVDRLTMGAILAEISRPDSRDPQADYRLKIGLLTNKERVIISLVSKGWKNKQIANHLQLSEITVRHHLSTIFRKLDVTDRFELIVFAFTQALCDLPTEYANSLKV
jgi:two-component system, NarL family, nitrate/nitrite response regulator NarL